jgi:hypothetical protein
MWPISLRGQEFLEINQPEQELPMAACSLTDRDEMSILYRHRFFLPSFSSFSEAVSEK